MRGFHKGKSFKVFIILICVALVLAVVCAFGYPFLSSGANFLTQGLSYAGSAVTASPDQLSYEELQAENQKLKSENAKLRSELGDYYDVIAENEKLWKFYDIKKENPQNSYVPATVIRRDANADFYSFTIDAGTNLGISVNDPVVTENGLIGIISECDATTSKVKTILSPEIKVGATGQKTKDDGIITGSGAYCDQNLTLLTKIPSTHTLKQGDIIVTSGVGGMFPKNLVIGQVKSTSVDNYDTSKFAVVEPYEDIRKVHSVLVITDFSTQGQISLEITPETTQPTTKKAE